LIIDKLYHSLLYSLRLRGKVSLMKWVVVAIYLVASVAAQAANENTTKILGFSQAQQSQFFTLVLKKQNCDRANRMMYQGGTSDGDDSWSVGCENGTDYSVGIRPGADSQVTVLTCKEVVDIDAMLMRRVGQATTQNFGCWHKFKQ
jgi:hypothetical protein